MNFKLLRFHLVFLAPVMSLTPLAAVLAQQPAQADTQTAGAARARPAEGGTVRPFRVSVPEEALVDLRRRLAATRWPERETVDDSSQGVQLAKIQELVRYWGTEYDWRKAEAKLNALPQFIANIDGVDIHFIHIRSRHPNALPLIMTHGWPGSVFELLKTIGSLPPRRRMAAAPRTRSTLYCRRFPASASPGSRRGPAGAPTASPALGTCS